MDTNTNSVNDVLHSDHHSKLSAEEIAKAVARHNRHHPGSDSKTAPAASKRAANR